MTTIAVHICVNDPDNGSFTGYVDGIEFATHQDTLLKLNGSPTVCKVEHSPNSHKPRRLKIGRRWWPILGYGTWVGNWCWDAARMADEAAAGLINYLHQSGRWEPEEGLDRLWDKWDRGETFTAGDFEMQESDYWTAEEIEAAKERVEVLRELIDE